MENTVIDIARKQLYKYLIESKALSVTEEGVPSIADSSNRSSIAISTKLLSKITQEAHRGAKVAGQTAGNHFEIGCKDYLEQTFLKLQHMRPGDWSVKRSAEARGITQFVQYEHLFQVSKAVEENPTLATSIGTDYLIKPDVVIFRQPEEDSVINQDSNIVGLNEANLTSIRKANSQFPILHASVSCKWTIRSDRSQNARSEALNLIRNRKGHAPHVVVITAEPMPGRIASIALGTGDIDCVYHFALPELKSSLEELSDHSGLDTLNILTSGKRLKDISDLPLDLII